MFRSLAQAFVLCLTFSSLGWADGPSVLLSQRAKSDFALSADPHAKEWRKVTGVIAASSPFGKPLPEARTEVRSRWTNKNLYLRFVSRYEKLYLKTDPVFDRDTQNLWDYDVVEAFIGHDLQNIQVYKEFEVSPRGEFVDLDIDRTRKGEQGDITWDSGWRVKARVDSTRKIWYAEMQIPWNAILPHSPHVGDELRLNLYRIEGGPESRKYIVWQITNSPSFHTPESFGRLRLVP
jgi:hypothetical protein